jgi:ParB-like chromosome segregation protein Spo0J
MVRETSTGLVDVDGAHRIEAAKLLGMEKIEAVYFEGDEKASRIYELTQNATRAGTTVLDRAKVITGLVREVLGKSRAKELERGGRQPGDKGVSKTARVLGLPRDDIRRCMVIASMSEKAMAKAVKLDVDNNQAALLKIAQAEPDEQVALAEQLRLPRKKKQVERHGKCPSKFYSDAPENAGRFSQRNPWAKGKDTPNEDWDDPEDEQDGEDDDDEDHDGDEEDEEE